MRTCIKYEKYSGVTVILPLKTTKIHFLKRPSSTCLFSSEGSATVSKWCPVYSSGWVHFMKFNESSHSIPLNELFPLLRHKRCIAYKPRSNKFPISKYSHFRIQIYLIACYICQNVKNEAERRNVYQFVSVGFWH